MVLIEGLTPILPLINIFFFISATPFILWLNNKTRSDILCLLLGIGYMIGYGLIAQPSWDEWLFFLFGLVVGYVTDYWGVNSNKWKYHPWDPEFGYSYYVGFAWGMVSIFTYNIGKWIKTDIETLFLPGILFIVPMIILEWRYGETRRNQYFLFARALFTFFAFFAANELGLLFVAIFVGSWIEFAGVNWIKNWLYIDTMSYIFLSFGYSLVVLTAKTIINFIDGKINPLAVFFFVSAVLFYSVDTFWAQKNVQINTEKAVLAAKDYNRKQRKIKR